MAIGIVISRVLLYIVQGQKYIRNQIAIQLLPTITHTFIWIYTWTNSTMHFCNHYELLISYKRRDVPIEENIFSDVIRTLTHTSWQASSSKRVLIFGPSNKSSRVGGGNKSAWILIITCARLNTSGVPNTITPPEVAKFSEWEHKRARCVLVFFCYISDKIRPQKELYRLLFSLKYLSTRQKNRNSCLQLVQRKQNGYENEAGRFVCKIIFLTTWWWEICIMAQAWRRLTSTYITYFSTCFLTLWLQFEKVSRFDVWQK